ncbi:Fic/DOC family protein [Acetobacter nitrogenifigens]|uniref:Fic/DOC family protein n=1 Tax=Acetobacter nitrogenifigens TaxID=285268 RepID=UPI00042A8874|nr:Fic family protein [Acetobacter nitrogenifigens]
MTSGAAQHGYTYPNTSNDPDQVDVLRNRLGLRSHSRLSQAEYRSSRQRQIELRSGAGPVGNFDADHLKAIHRHLFSDIYEWAGHTRNERPVVDGRPVEPIGFLRKGETTFLPGSRLEMGLTEAFRPIRNPDTLHNATVKRFAAVAGQVLNELNYVHPFREGNGRAQEAFISELGRRYRHEVRFSVITRPRMIEASIAGIADPAGKAMRHLLEDAVDPARSTALAEIFAHLRQQGVEPLSLSIRTARPGETVSGKLAAVTARSGCVDTTHGMIVVPGHDVSSRNLTVGDTASLTVTSDFPGPPPDGTPLLSRKPQAEGFSRLASALTPASPPHSGSASTEWFERSVSPRGGKDTAPETDPLPRPPRSRRPSPGG